MDRMDQHTIQTDRNEDTLAVKPQIVQVSQLACACLVGGSSWSEYRLGSEAETGTAGMVLGSYFQGTT